jgi:KDZ transposase-like protein
MVRQGLMPCAPFSPTLAFSTRVMELYRNSHLCCPHLAIQPFVKGLCDLHRVPFRPYLSQQFSICYDLYLSIREGVTQRVDVVLDRNSSNWRLRNACPACCYKFKDEPAQIFEMLVTMDGNDSLKRILRRKPAPESGDELNVPPVGESRELADSRKVGGGYYISRERVDRWAKEVLEDLLPESILSEKESGDEQVDTNPCATRWSNMVNELTARMWGIFDETGIFLALCRHGFVLVVADMVQSGEL